MHVSEGQLYAATVADFSGGEPLIHRDKIRTERSDLNQLNGNGTRANCIRIFIKLILCTRRVQRWNFIVRRDFTAFLNFN